MTSDFWPIKTFTVLELQLTNRFIIRIIFLLFLFVSSVIKLIFKGQMEFAIISFSVGEKTSSWLFHVNMILYCLLHREMLVILRTG